LQIVRQQEDKELREAILRKDMEAAGIKASAEAIEIAQAFDRLADPAQRNAVAGMLRAWGVMK
jgi:hypothetical protein